MRPAPLGDSAPPDPLTGFGGRIGKGMERARKGKGAEKEGKGEMRRKGNTIEGVCAIVFREDRRPCKVSKVSIFAQ